MGKKEKHRQDLDSLIEAAVEAGRADPLTSYLVANSNLPGRRANLELAAAFGDSVEARINGENESLWQLCSGLTRISADEAPVNSPREFLPFCGTIGMGAIGAISAEFYDKALTDLRFLANDPRWRMREAVRFGLQRLLAERPEDTLRRLEEWATPGSPLEMRAAAASVAEPSILENEEIAVASLHLHDRIFGRILGWAGRKSETFGVLRKGLGYTLSVVVAAIPEEGFEFMERLVASRDPDVLWIVKQNLKKRRLAGKHPDAVDAIQQLLD